MMSRHPELGCAVVALVEEQRSPKRAAALAHIEAACIVDAPARRLQHPPGRLLCVGSEGATACEAHRRLEVAGTRGIKSAAPASNPLATAMTRMNE